MRVTLHTLGCKLNQAETSAIAKAFRRDGFEVVDLGSRSDVVVVNTCTVTETADRECRQVIRRARRMSPGAYVIVTGCYAQLQPERVASIEGVDLVVGSREKTRVLALAGDLTKRATPRIEVSEPSRDDFGPAFSHRTDGRVRAFLKVQDGCDYNCSFCTIPLARGPSRSQSVADCVAQAEKLVDQGFREIVLTGVNLGDFGRHSGSSLIELLCALDRVAGLSRLTISSIEPNLLTEEIIDLAARSPRLLPHFHMPLQSGDADVLKGMRRRYTRGRYADRVAAIRAAVPDAAIGADVIVGFPGETEDAFAETCEFIEALRLTYLHVFTYSERADTPARSMPGQVARVERRRRNRVLRELSAKLHRRFARSQQGLVRPVLFEAERPDGRLTGLTDNYLRVSVPAPAQLIGDVAEVRLGRAQARELTGEWNPAPSR